MAVATEKMLGEMAEIIVRELQPARILLFGSYGRGDMNEQSDLDLLILMTDAPPDRVKATGRLYRLLAGFRIPKDILLYTEEEAKRWGGSLNHVVARAFREGRILYERG